MTWIILIMGFIFGSVLQYSKLNKFNTISGMAILEDLTVAKTIATAIGLGAIFISIEVSLGLASYHIKPVMIENLIIGGLIFGIGMAILGYCPGTLPISLGQGSIDALFGILGGFAAGFTFINVNPFLKSIFNTNLGEFSIHSAIGDNPVLFFILIFMIGLSFVAFSFWLNKIEKKNDYKWFYSGLGVAVLACFVFATALTDKPLGVSGFYTHIAELVTDSSKHLQASKSGIWHENFLLGAFISGVVLSLIKKEFKFKIVYENWSRFKGNSATKRLIWAFTGGYLIIFGSRLATGCTSGHIISGGMQMALSSYIFAACVFGAFLLTGKFFYRK